MPIDSGRTGGPREIGQDERDVPSARDHGVISVGCALTDTAGMYMHIGDDAHAAAFADVPECAEIPAVEMHDAGVERVRIEIVVQDEIDDPSAPVRTVAEQERATFAACVPAALAQLCAQALPKKPRAGELMPRRQQAGNNLRN